MDYVIYTQVSWSEAREWCGNSNDAEKRHLVSFEVPDELDHVFGLLITVTLSQIKKLL